MEQGLGLGYRSGGPSAVRLVWIYPDLLSTYGDRGNLLVLARRARLRGIPVEIAEVNSDQRVPVDGDIYLWAAARTCRRYWPPAGSGPAAGCPRPSAGVRSCSPSAPGTRSSAPSSAAPEGEPVPGLGLLDIRSGRGERRGVGEIIGRRRSRARRAAADRLREPSGRHPARPQVKPLATVVTGAGNGDGTEGAYSGRVVGTYLHGPALVRNPGLADLLLGWVAGSLPPIDPRQEELVQRPAPRAPGRRTREQLADPG